eukprot:1389230-Pyramimonas_sp.AAC.1
MITIDAFLQALVHNLGDRCLVRAFAEGIAIIRPRMWTDGPVTAFLFSGFARMSNLKSLPRKCVMVPRWSIL